MEHLFGFCSYHINKSPSVFSLGFFDGVHRGHQYLLTQARDLATAEGMQLVVCTFSSSPKGFPLLIASKKHKALLLEQLGVDILLELPFEHAIQQLSAEAFIQNVEKMFQLQRWVVGTDVCWGADREGNRQFLEKYALRSKQQALFIKRYRLDQKPISSTYVREAIQQGNLSLLQQLLGRPYTIFAPSVSGQGLAKKIGYPTVNLYVENLLLPPLGVWVAGVSCYPDVTEYRSLVYFSHEMHQKCEVHLLDHSPIETPQELEVRLIRYLRPKYHFTSQKLLVEQIQKDIQEARNLPL